MEISSGSSSKVIPESVMEAVKRTSSNIDEVKANLEEFLSYCDSETLSGMEPHERARALLLISKATTTFFALRLRCKGVDPDEHPVKKELERLNLYQDKLQQCIDLSKEQRQSMRAVSQGEGPRFKYCDSNLQKKEKVPVS